MAGVRTQQKNGTIFSTDPAFPFSLPAIGDSVVLSGGPFTQIDKLTTGIINTTNTNATRTIRAEFATGTDGKTFSQFKELTTANLNAVVLDPNDTLYINTKITRNGSETSGTILIDSFQYTFTIDSTAIIATSGITEPYLDIEQIVLGAIKDNVRLSKGAPMFDVVFGSPQDCLKPKKARIYMNQFSTADSELITNCTVRNEFTFRVGVSRIKQRKASNRALMSSQVATLLSMFGMGTYNFATFTHEYKDKIYNGSRWLDFGMRELSTSSQVDFYDPVCDRLDTEFQVFGHIEFAHEFDLQFV